MSISIRMNSMLKFSILFYILMNVYSANTTFLEAIFSLMQTVFLKNSESFRQKMIRRMDKYIRYFFCSMKLRKLPPNTDRLLDYDIKMQLFESGALHSSWLDDSKEKFYDEYQFGLQIIYSLSISRWIISIITRDKHLALQLADTSALFGDGWLFIEAIMLILYIPKLIEHYLPRCDQNSTEWLKCYFEPLNIEQKFSKRWTTVRKWINYVYLFNWSSYCVIILLLNIIFLILPPIFFLSPDHSLLIVITSTFLSLICTITTLRRYFVNIFIFQSYAILSMFELEKSINDFQILGSCKNPTSIEIIPSIRRYLSKVKEISNANRVISIFGGSTYMTGFFVSALCFFVTFLMNAKANSKMLAAFGIILVAALVEGVISTSMVPFICFKPVSILMNFHFWWLIVDNFQRITEFKKKSKN